MSGSLLVVPEHLAGVSSSCAGEVSHTSREFVLHVVLVDVLPVISALLERPVVGAPRDEVQLVNHQDLLVPLGPQVVTGDVLPSVMLLFRVVCSQKLVSSSKSVHSCRSVGNSQVDYQ